MDVFAFLKYMVEEEHKMIDTLLEKLNEEDLLIDIAENETTGDRLRHMSVAEFRMAGYLYPKGEETFEINEINLDNLKKGFLSSMNRHLETLDNLNVDDLEKMWKSKVSGNEYSYKWLLYHFLEHLSTHRGQVAMAVRIHKDKNQ